MDKLAMKALEKLQKREHLIRVTKWQAKIGIITQDEAERRQAEINDQYRLTPEEQRAYDQYVRLQQQRRKPKKRR